MDKITYTVGMEITVNYESNVQEPPKIGLLIDGEQKLKVGTPQFYMKMCDLVAWSMAAMFQDMRQNGGEGDKAMQYFVRKLEACDIVQKQSDRRQ